MNSKIVEDELDRVEALARMLVQVGLTVSAAAATGLSVGDPPRNVSVALVIALVGAVLATTFAGLALAISPARLGTGHRLDSWIRKLSGKQLSSDRARLALDLKRPRTSIALTCLLVGVLGGAGWAAVA